MRSLCHAEPSDGEQLALTFQPHEDFTHPTSPAPSPVSHHINSALILFAGRNYPGNLSSALQNRDYQVKAFDTESGGSDQDVMKTSVLNRLQNSISEIKYDTICGSLPPMCFSFSVLWLEPGRTQRLSLWMLVSSQKVARQCAQAQLSSGSFRRLGSNRFLNWSDLHDRTSRGYRGYRGSHLFEERIHDHSLHSIPPE